jgi:hypothetical protein
MHTMNHSNSLKYGHPLFNPDSGGHALPDDPREIDAVLRATELCFAAHPYFLERFGTRGRLFANSDGGYLVAITDTSQSHVHEQVLWLSRVLSARGMPSLLMEVHLLFLHAELRKRVPEDTLRFTRLRRAATRLRTLRLARMAQADFDAVAAEFSASAGPGIDNAGCLLAAAVCDERGGWTEAVPSLVKWLGDSARFSPRWCSAVNLAIVRARSMALPAPP